MKTNKIDDEIIDPPKGLELDKNGIGYFSQKPSKEELLDSGDEQWNWGVTNNYPDRKFRKGIRIGYFTQEQCDFIDRCREQLNREDQILYTALFHIAKIMFPNDYSSPETIENFNLVNESLVKGQRGFKFLDIHFKMRNLVYEIKKDKTTEIDFYNYFEICIKKFMRDNQEFLDALNKLTEWEKTKIKMYYLGAIKLTSMIQLYPQD